MSTQFTTDPIETLPEWNAVLAGDCCCQMPVCPVPTRECESITGIAGCPLAPDPGEEPAENESITYGCFIPFEAAALDAEDDLAVYTMLRELFKTNVISGTYKSYYVDNVEDSGVAYLYSRTYSPPGFASDTWKSWFQTTVEDPTGIWDITMDTGSADVSGPSVPETVTTWESVADTCEKTTTTLIKNTGVETSISGDVDTFRTDLNGDLVETTNPASVTFSSEFAWDLRRSEGRQEFTLSVSYTKAALIAAAEADLPAEFPSPATGSDCIASRIETWPKKKDFTWPVCAETTVRNAGIGCSVTKARFRWVIPEAHGGTYFKITWDVVFFPTSGSPVLISANQTWDDWEGPGDPEDADSWKSGWYEIDPPEEPGEVRVVNIRFECYQGPYGNKPQITGEAYDIPT
jgi:hypothetical protein